MKGRKAFVTLLSLASLCAPHAASAQTARVEAAPPVKWADVRVEFEGNRVFTAGQLSKAAVECYERLGKGEQEFEPELLAYCLRTDVRWMLLRAGYVRSVVREPRLIRGQ